MPYGQLHKGFLLSPDCYDTQLCFSKHNHLPPSNYQFTCSANRSLSLTSHHKEKSLVLTCKTPIQTTRCTSKPSPPSFSPAAPSPVRCWKREKTASPADSCRALRSPSPRPQGRPTTAPNSVWKTAPWRDRPSAPRRRRLAGPHACAQVLRAELQRRVEDDSGGKFERVLLQSRLFFFAWLMWEKGNGLRLGLLCITFHSIQPQVFLP